MTETATQATETNENVVNQQENASNNVEQNNDSSNFKNVRDLNRSLKKENQQLNGELKEVKGKLDDFNNTKAELEEIKKDYQTIIDKISKNELEQKKQQSKNSFFENYPHLKEYKDEIEQNSQGDNFEQDALLYIAKNKPNLLSQEGVNKQKTKQMGISGTPTNGQTGKSEADMTPDEYLDYMRQQGKI